MYEYRTLTPEQRMEVVKQRVDRGFPPHAPPHPVQNQRFYLLTATCFEHKPIMQSEARRQQVLDLVFEVFINNGIEIRAWVVLPNHYHLLVYLENFKLLGSLFRAVHGPTAREWNVEDNTVGRKVWYKYSDRAIRSERHYYTTINYIHYNPVKHGWTKSPYDWAQSSVHWYLEYYGREWLRDLWMNYPVRNYGRGWDEF
jgi:putative transposase